MKQVYNLLGDTVSPVLLDSTDQDNVFARKRVDNLYAKTGCLYIDAAGFTSSPTAGVTFGLYTNYGQGDVWYLHTDTTLSTASNVRIELDNLGKACKLGYSMGAPRLDKARVFLELDEEY